MKPALPRLALAFLTFVLGCHATAVRDAAQSASLPAGAVVRARTGPVATLDYSGGAPAGYFVSTTGSTTGAGTLGSPWTLATAFAGGYPGGTIHPGDTVWIRGGTYTGQFVAMLAGTPENYITFRAYPGERVTIDGNYDNAQTGNGQPTVKLSDYFGTRGYMILRDVEITNSQTNRIVSAGLHDARGDCVVITAPHSKVINCVLHDCGEGIFPSSVGSEYEVYGNLVYYNGYKAPVGEQNVAASIDLIPAAGIAVAVSGTFDTSTGASPRTFSHNNTGDYTVVAARSARNPYTTLSATFDGAAMTLLNGKDGYSAPIAVFGIAGHAGTHNVVVTDSRGSGGGYLAAIAQSFVNVHQTTPPSVGATWSNDQWHLPPFGATTTSAANHMVVDGINIYNAYSAAQNYNASGDNTRIGGPAGGNNPVARLSYASGAASVNMAWNWTPNLYGHGHGMYIQNGGSENVIARAGDNTILWAGSPPVNGPFRIFNKGAKIVINGAGPAGANLITTITTYTNNGSIEVADTPSTSVNPTEAAWGHASKITNNIILDQMVQSIQIYGSSSAAAINVTVAGNLHFNTTTVLGGLGGFRMTESKYDGNYTWSNQTNVGYHMTHLTNFAVTNNYFDHATAIVVAPSAWDNFSMTGNTFIGTVSGFTSTDFPANTYSPSNPVTNKVVVQPNAYEANRANILVYNWENLTSVDVDLSSAVAVGTPINIMNAQDYYASPVFTGTYAGGTVSLPMTGLTVAAAVGTDYTPVGSTAPGFAAFIVRAQEPEPLRPILPASPPPQPRLPRE